MVQLLWDTPQVFCVSVDLPDSPLKNLNSYVIRNGDDTLVIDTGYNHPQCREALFSGLDELGVQFQRTALFLTHLHADHIGLVQEFVRRGSTVYMGQLDYALCIREYPRNWASLESIFIQEGYPERLIPLRRAAIRTSFGGPEVPFPAVAIGNGYQLHVGDCVFTCIHTPGHTPGHMVLYLPEQQLLFSGDHILFQITPNISVWEGIPHSLKNYLTSLEHMLTLSVQRVFPAHRTCDGDFYGRIKELIHHHELRLEETFSAVLRHPDSDAYTLAGFLTWSARGLGWDAFPPQQKWFALGETLAHLYYLERAGQIKRIQDGYSYRYHAG